jgi:hypothetical protein
MMELQHNTGMYPGRWTGQEGLVAWPSHLLDLNQLDYFLWEHLKEYIYTVHPRTTGGVAARLQVSVRTAGANVLRLVQGNSMLCTAI